MLTVTELLTKNIQLLAAILNWPPSCPVALLRPPPSHFTFSSKYFKRCNHPQWQYSIFKLHTRCPKDMDYCFFLFSYFCSAKGGFNLQTPPPLLSTPLAANK